MIFAFLLYILSQFLQKRFLQAYDGVYIAASLLWLWLIIGNRPDKCDVLGSNYLWSNSVRDFIWTETTGIMQNYFNRIHTKLYGFGNAS
jgi:drug/metabolite transporter superfamily protein YnfA